MAPIKPEVYEERKRGQRNKGAVSKEKGEKI